jgi:hypothetical protein
MKFETRASASRDEIREKEKMRRHPWQQAAMPYSAFSASFDSSGFASSLSGRGSKLPLPSGVLCPMRKMEEGKVNW